MQTRPREKRCPHVKEQNKAGRICDVTQPPARHRHVARRHAAHNDNVHQDDAVFSYPRPTVPAQVKAPKAVDEDLYKIPPELLRSANRVSVNRSNSDTISYVIYQSVHIERGEKDKRDFALFSESYVS